MGVASEFPPADIKHYLEGPAPSSKDEETIQALTDQTGVRPQWVISPETAAEYLDLREGQLREYVRDLLKETKVLFLHGLESKPGGTKVQYLQSMGHTVLNPALPKNDFEESVRIAQEEVDTNQPDVIVGSSRGGAVAMELDTAGARLVLIAPAWEKFGSTTSVPPGTNVLHCTTDDEVPISDSEKLKGATLIPCGEGHRMIDPDALESLGQAVEGTLKTETIIREYVRELICESHFPIYAQDKMRIHHSRGGTRSGAEPQVSGFSQKIDSKPEGLWYECQDGSSETWEEFCTGGLTGGYDKYDSTYNVVLKDDGYHILHITDEQHLEKFNKMYSVNHSADPDGTKGLDKMIDWPKVAEHYAGIEICPYLSSKRNDDDFFWYYGWDVASGCIWDQKGIEELVKAGDCDESAT